MKNIIAAILVYTSLLILLATECKSKQHTTGAKSRLAQCQASECELSPSHYALYSSIKRAIESQFDIKPKEIYPLINSVKVLELRFGPAGVLGESAAAKQALNGTELVHKLLANEGLVEALRVFGSPEGRALIDLYRAPTNGKDQNLACSKFKIDDIERAGKKLEDNADLAGIFANIHKQFVRKSAKKCLSKSCNSIDIAMSRLDYMLGKYRAPVEVQVVTAEPSFDTTTASGVETQPSSAQAGSTTTTSSSSSSMTECTEKLSQGYKREFADQELELCRFFKRSNETDCNISGSELREISQLFGRERQKKLDKIELEYSATGATIDQKQSVPTSPPADYLKSYIAFKQQQGLVAASIKETLATGAEVNKGDSFKRDLDGLQLILDQCRPVMRLLDYNLAGLQWYAKQDAKNEGKLYSRLAWCPKLSYWYHLHKLCGYLETFDQGASLILSY